MRRCRWKTRSSCLKFDRRAGKWLQRRPARIWVVSDYFVTSEKSRKRTMKLTIWHKITMSLWMLSLKAAKREESSGQCGTLVNTGAIFTVLYHFRCASWREGTFNYFPLVNMGILWLAVDLIKSGQEIQDFCWWSMSSLRLSSLPHLVAWHLQCLDHPKFREPQFHIARKRSYVFLETEMIDNPQKIRLRIFSLLSVITLKHWLGDCDDVEGIETMYLLSSAGWLKASRKWDNYIRLLRRVEHCWAREGFLRRRRVRFGKVFEINWFNYVKKGRQYLILLPKKSCCSLRNHFEI